MRWGLAGLLLVACASAPAEPDVSALEATSGPYRCRFALEPDPPALGELFSVEVQVETDGAPVAGAEVEVDATMPDHGHGMLTRPRHRALGDGRYRTEGMKLHMAGRWAIAATIGHEGREETCRVRWDQPPGP